MTGLCADLEVMLDRAGLSEEVSHDILAVLDHASNTIPPCKGVRLLRFLTSLKTGAFLNLASGKTPLLENFTELLCRDMESVSRICRLYFEGMSPQGGTEALLPEEMVKELLVLGRVERVQRVKALVWDLLLKQGDQLARLVSPEDIAFSLWLDSPVTRNKLIIFALRHVGAEKAMQLFRTYASRTGKAIPPNVSRQLMELVRAESRMKYRKGILSGTAETSELSYDAMDRLWSEYLNSRNRFELIRIFLLVGDALNRLEALNGDPSQVPLNFKDAEARSEAAAAFASRVHAVRSGK